MIRTLLMSTFVGILTGHASARDCPEQVPTVTSGVLTVASYDYPPFSVVDPAGGVSGIDADVVRAVAEDLCLETAFVAMEPAATIQSIVTGRADVAIGSWYRTSKRAQIVDVSAPLYLDRMGILSKDGTDALTALDGRKVGTVTGFHWVAEMQKVFGRDLMLYPDPVMLTQDLVAGRLSAAFTGYNYVLYAQKFRGAYEGLKLAIVRPDERVAASVLPQQIGLLYTKGNAPLGRSMDATILRLQKEGRIRDSMVAAGFDEDAAAVGEPRLVD